MLNGWTVIENPLLSTGNFPLSSTKAASLIRPSLGDFRTAAAPRCRVQGGQEVAVLASSCASDADSPALRGIPICRGRHLLPGWRPLVVVVANGCAARRQTCPACSAAHNVTAWSPARNTQVSPRGESVLDHVTSRCRYATQGGVPVADCRRPARVHVRKLWVIGMFDVVQRNSQLL